MENVHFHEENCVYDPVRDISPVVPNDFVDLQSAFDSGFVPENVVLGDADYDGNDEPQSILGRPANEFDAIHMGETVKTLANSKSKVSSTTGE